MKVTKKFTREDLKYIYDEHFEALRGFLYYKCGDIELAEDLVQEVFIKVWHKRDEIQQETAHSLLYTMAKNLMINHFKHQKVVQNHQDGQKKRNSHSLTPQFELEHEEFRKKLNATIAAMPEGAREVFLMNRIDKLKYDVIAERLEISVKTVEKRMSKALAIIKEKIRIKV